MFRLILPYVAVVLLVTSVSAQQPRAPIQLRGSFGGVTQDQFYQDSIAYSAGQLAAEVRHLRNEVSRSRLPFASKVVLTRQAEQAVRAADNFREVAESTADRNRLYRTHESVDQAIERLVTGLRQTGVQDPRLADAVARVQHADQQTHIAMTGGDNTPDVNRRRASRLAGALSTQTEQLQTMVYNRPGADAGLNRSLQDVVNHAGRMRQTLDTGGSMDQAAIEHRAATRAWQDATPGLNRVFTSTPQARAQAARVDGLFRSLSEIFPDDAPNPLPIPRPPGIGFLTRGALAVAAGDTGGPRVRVYRDHRNHTDDVTDFFAYDPNFRGGVRVAVADLNGDDVPDVITAPGPGMPPLVRVFDGRTLRLMTAFMAYDRSWTGGVFVAATDLGPDGRALVVTGTDNGAGPHVKMFDLATGQEVHSFFAYEEQFRGGVRVAVADVNGDGVPDIITAAGPGGGPAVKVFNGRDRSELASFFAFDTRERNGVYVAAADAARGRRAEIIVGGGVNGPPIARVFDALRGRHVADLRVFPANYRNGIRVAIYDYDRDGVTDFVCAPGSGGLPVRVYSGRDRRMITEFYPFEEQFQGGIFVGGR
jgi:hypothetical protein